MDFKEKRPVSLDKTKIECYNCHRKGHFARECRSGRNQGRRSYGDNGRSNAPTNESSSQALVAQDGLGGYDWSNDFEVEPVNYALMAISSSSSSSSSDSEVQKCSKQCLESFKTLQKNYDTEREKHNKAKLEIRGYEIALESLESRILGHEKNELAWGEKYEFQNYELKCREIKINNLNLELEKVVKERDELKDKIAKWEESTKNLDEILNSQMSARDKTGLGYVDRCYLEDWISDNEDEVLKFANVRPVNSNNSGSFHGESEILLQDSCSGGYGCASLMTWQQMLIFQTYEDFMEDLWLLDVIPRRLKYRGKKVTETLIEAAITMLAGLIFNFTDFGLEAVNNACYVLNSVFNDQTSIKTPYELLNRFFCLDTLPLVKPLEYTTKGPKGLEENLTFNFLELSTKCAGTGPIGCLILIFSQFQGIIFCVSVEIRLMWMRIYKVQNEFIDKEGQHQMQEDEQVLQDELEMMVTQELVANAMNDVSRQAFEEEKRRIASQ
ncbi:putative ribonuclease H-like domain-containing protein [Tanacetum coccineum]